MPDQPLIDAATLARSLDRATTVVVDCRFNLLDPAAGRNAYERGHIPGARYADLDRDLSRTPGAGEGRHPLPNPSVLAAQLGEWGIGRDSTVVAYDEGGGAIAARLWWLLRWLGHTDSRVLDGGFAAWRAAGLPIETAQPTWEPARFEPQPAKMHWIASTAEVAALSAQDLLVDARGAARFRGEQEPIDPAAGHVPGAVNWPFSNALMENETFRSPEQLRHELGVLLEGRASEQVIAMCGSGVTACHVLLAMRVAGLGDGRLYAGSWSEWIRDPSRPIKTGAEP